MMKHFKFKHFIVLALSVFALALTIAIAGFWPSQVRKSVPQQEGAVPQLSHVNTIVQNQIDESIPEAAQACLPEHFATAELMAKVQDGDKTLYYVRILSGDDGDVPLISVSNGQCTVLNAPVDNVYVPLRSVVPNSKVLEELIIQRYKTTFKDLGGKDKFQTLLNESIANGETEAFDQENYDALIKLGIQIPENIKIIKSEQEFER